MGSVPKRHLVSVFALACVLLPSIKAAESPPARPNFVVIYADDLRADGLSALGGPVPTPNIDRLVGRGVRFPHAIVASALCTPSRAQLLTGRYSSQNGVAELPAEKPGDTAPRRTRFNPGEPLVAAQLRAAGYATAMVGKWHIDNPPTDCGFDFVRSIYGNGDYRDQVFINERGARLPRQGHVEDVNAAFGREFLARAQAEGRPFFLFYNTRAPHMDSRYAWPSDEATRRRFPAEEFRLPGTLDGSLAGKPDYLARSRSRAQALHYGYGDPARVRQHAQEYHAAVAELDMKIAPLLMELERAGLRESTYVIFMGDNGWFLGEHLFTSKVLAYEESIRVPLFISGPGIGPGVSQELALNLDIAPTLLEAAGLEIPQKVYGRSLLAAARQPRAAPVRDAALYEMAPASDTARNPFIRALRTSTMKLIRTYKMGSETEIAFVELYDLANDSEERHNLATDPAYADQLRQLNARLDREIAAVASRR